jgi:hypothetical protein
LTIRETIKDVLENSLFPNDDRRASNYFIEKHGHLIDNEWAHIGKYIDAWSADNKLVIEWYGVHLVFVSK